MSVTELSETDILKRLQSVPPFQAPLQKTGTGSMLLVLSSSEVLVASQSPTAKEYQAHICLGCPEPADPTRRWFCCAVTYGRGGAGRPQTKVYGFSPMLGEVLTQANTKMAGKYDRGYRTMTDGDFPRSQTRQDVMTGARRLLGL